MNTLAKAHAKKPCAVSRKKISSVRMPTYFVRSRPVRYPPRAETSLHGCGIRRQTIERDRRRQRGEDGKEREESAPRRHHREIVAIAFAPYPLSHLPSTLERDLVRTRRVAACGSR